MTESLQPIYTAANVQQAYLLVGALSERGIDAQVTNAALQGLHGSVPVGPENLPQVCVATSRAAEARQVALEFERREQQRLQRLKEHAPGPRANQFTLRALFWLVTCAAVYLAVLAATANLPPRAQGPIRAVSLQFILLCAFFLAAYRKFKQRRKWPDE